MVESVEKEEKVGSWMKRVEIETSVPFLSVKEAIGLFGGGGRWKPQNKNGCQSHELCLEECSHDVDVNVKIMEKQTEQLRNDIAVKEKETLDVLRELEMTKSILDDLKVKLYKNTPEATTPSDENLNLVKIHPLDSSARVKSPRLILMELKGVRDILAVNQSSINITEGNTEKEDGLCQPTKMSFLEKELSQTQKMIDQARQMLRFTIDAGDNEGIEDLQDGSTTRQFNGKVEVAVTSSETDIMSEEMEPTDASFEMNKKNIEAGIPTAAERSKITQEENGAEELCRKKIEAAIAQVEEAKKTKQELLKKIEEAKADMHSSRKALEDALQRVEATFKQKHTFNNIPRKRRSKLVKKRRSIHKSPRFKSSPNQRRRDARTYNCIDASRPTLSIGQILRRKLVGPEELQIQSKGEPEVSLREILNIHRSLSAQNNAPVASSTCKQLQTGKKKFHFKGFLAKS